jgi:hypothetical protein
MPPHRRRTRATATGWNHQPLCVAVSPLPAQLPRGRGDDDSAGGHHQLRDDPGVVGARSVRPSRTGCVAVGPGPVTSGISTRCSSRSIASTGWDQGGRSTRTAPCWTSWSPPGVTPRPPPGSLANYSRDCGPCRGCWSPTASHGVVHRRLMPGMEHHQSKYLNNRAENSHQPTRQTGTGAERPLLFTFGKQRSKS